MATQRWFSSLANIEARVRRSLGISGPINLSLDPQPHLTPVMICDDQTRPGCASDYRGRRFAISSTPGTIAAGATGGVWWILNTVTPASSNFGGVIIDTIDIMWGGAVATQQVTTVIHYSSPFTAPPVALVRDGIMVDPCGPVTGGAVGIYEPSPMSTGTSVAINPNGTGNRIWGGFCLTNATRVLINVDLLLKEQAFLSVGNSVGLVAAQPATMHATLRGRVF